jgi:hypothetical protein
LHKVRNQAPPEIVSLKRLLLIFGIVSVVLIIVLYSKLYPKAIWTLEDIVTHIHCNKKQIYLPSKGRGVYVGVSHFVATTRKGYSVTAKTCPAIQVGDVIKFKELKRNSNDASSFVYLE